MSKADLDWDLYAEAWQDDHPHDLDLSTLERTLRRRRLVTLLVVLGEVALTVGLVAFTWLWTRDPGVLPGTWVLIGMWAAWLLATVFAWWNRRGQWAVSVASLDEFARLSRDRAVRKIRVVWFSLVLTVLQLPLLYAIEGDARARVWSLAAVLIGALCGWAIWYYRRAVAERVHFESILAGGPEDEKE